jgi:tetratricopeptide (TPR) repeat protein
MGAKTDFQKALLLLDRGDQTRGEALLLQAIQASKDENDPYTEGQALCAMGELLKTLGRREEARPILGAVLAMPRRDDLLDYERAQATRLLKELDEE